MRKAKNVIVETERYGNAKEVKATTATKLKRVTNVEFSLGPPQRQRIQHSSERYALHQGECLCPILMPECCRCFASVWYAERHQGLGCASLSVCQHICFAKRWQGPRWMAFGEKPSPG